MDPDLVATLIFIVATLISIVAILVGIRRMRR